jgi:hypothetical protein
VERREKQSARGTLRAISRVCDVRLRVRASGLLVQPIIKFAGQDISHWFDPKTKEVSRSTAVFIVVALPWSILTTLHRDCLFTLQPKTHISPLTGLRLPYTPYGRYLHIPPADPTANFDNSFDKSWWSDEQYQVGYLSRQKRKIRIINMLSHQSDLLEVCAEERLRDIRDRYLVYNRHALSYTWKRLGRVLNMELNLEENNIPDETEEFANLNIDEDQYIPALHVHFNDDLTID